MRSRGKPRLLHERFEHQARATPDRVSLHGAEGPISYSDLRTRAGDVASALRARGVRAGTLVGLHMERSISWVASVIGVLEAGGAVLPLPPSYPAARLREILRFSSPGLVLDHPDTPLPRPASPEVVSIVDVEPSTAPFPRPGDASPEQAAFVLCSSGSTGRPKMIVRSHESFFHRLEWTWGRHPFGPDDLGCAKAHVTTTHLVYELFEPLLGGAPTLVLGDAEVRSLEAFWRTLRERGVTRLLLVPSMLRASLAMPDFRPPPLRVVVLMGEYVPAELARRALEVLPSETSFYSIYGSTEASSTILCDVRAQLRRGEELALGEPISPDVGVRVLDDALGPVSDGEVGRLYVSGTPLFREYLGDPELTSSVLIRREDVDLYDTRDDVRRSDGGDLHFVGRADHTVKVRGFRVDLPEVERAMLAHSGVGHAAVVTTVTDGAGATLIGFFSPPTVDRSGLYATIRERLPDYMVPARLVGLEELPLTSSGKVDRAGLRESYEEPKADRPKLSDASRTEEEVAGVWAEVLGHGAFSLDSSFFEAGGSSLAVFSLTHHLREALGLSPEDLGEDVVYRDPTIRGVARHVERVRAGTAVRGGRSMPLLVTLRKGEAERSLDPVFLVASAGGTLGAYEKLVRSLRTDREIIGVRDPMLWDGRDATEGFERWVGRYLDAIEERQSTGPFHLCAYSSAGAFGYEIARRLTESGQRVALLALIDPLGLSYRVGRGFGYWALRATWMGTLPKLAVRAAGRLREPFVSLASRTISRGRVWDDESTPDERRRLLESVRRDKGHLMNLAALFELNTGLPFSLSDSDFRGVSPEGRLDVFRRRASSVTPDVDPAMLERIVLQYELQVRAQHGYRLGRLDAPVLLVEPATPYAGLIASLIRPYAPRLTHRVLPLGEPSPAVRSATERFGGLQGHYRSMRDETFVAGLAEELSELL